MHLVAWGTLDTAAFTVRSYILPYLLSRKTFPSKGDRLVRYQPGNRFTCALIVRARAFRVRGDLRNQGDKQGRLFKLSRAGVQGRQAGPQGRGARASTPRSGTAPERGRAGPRVSPRDRPTGFQGNRCARGDQRGRGQTVDRWLVFSQNLPRRARYALPSRLA